MEDRLEDMGDEVWTDYLQALLEVAWPRTDDLIPTASDLVAAGVRATGQDHKLILEAPAYAKSCIRDALIESHPDQGGDVEKFHLVQEARKVLSEFHRREL